MPGLNLYYRVIVLETAWYSTKTDMKNSGSEKKSQTKTHTDIGI
jgi:hypothetical protein